MCLVFSTAKFLNTTQSTAETNDENVDDRLPAAQEAFAQTTKTRSDNTVPFLAVSNTACNHGTNESHAEDHTEHDANNLTSSESCATGSFAACTTSESIPEMNANDVATCKLSCIYLYIYESMSYGRTSFELFYAMKYSHRCS